MSSLLVRSRTVHVRKCTRANRRFDGMNLCIPPADGKAKWKDKAGPQVPMIEAPHAADAERSKRFETKLTERVLFHPCPQGKAGDLQ